MKPSEIGFQSAVPGKHYEVRSDPNIFVRYGERVSSLLPSADVSPDRGVGRYERGDRSGPPDARQSAMGF